MCPCRLPKAVLLSSRLRNDFWDSLSTHYLFRKDKIKERLAFKWHRRCGMLLVLLKSFYIKHLLSYGVYFSWVRCHLVWFCPWSSGRRSGWDCQRTGNEHRFLEFFKMVSEGDLMMWWPGSVSNFLLHPEKSCNFLKVTELLGYRDGACQLRIHCRQKCFEIIYIIFLLFLQITTHAN